MSIIFFSWQVISIFYLTSSCIFQVFFVFKRITFTLLNFDFHGHILTVPSKTLIFTFLLRIFLTRITCTFTNFDRFSWSDQFDKLYGNQSVPLTLTNFLFPWESWVIRSERYGQKLSGLKYLTRLLMDTVDRYEGSKILWIFSGFWDFYQDSFWDFFLTVLPLG